MAITILGNQAIGIPANYVELQCGNTYCQPVNWDDVLYAQGKVTPIDDNDIVFDGGFDTSGTWTSGTSWTIAGSKATYQFTSGSSLLVSEPLGLVAGRMYKFKTRIVVTDATGIADGTGYSITINGQAVPLPDSVSAHNDSVDIEWFFVADAIASDNVQFDVGATDIKFYVEYATIYRVSDVNVALYRMDDTLEAASVGTITYIEDVAFDETLADARFNFEVTLSDEAGETTGCYYLCFEDEYGNETNLILNGTFAGNLNFWTVTGAEFAYNSGHALFTYVNGVSNIKQTATVQGGHIYTVSFDYNVTSGHEEFSVLVSVNNSVVSTNNYTNSATGEEITIDLSAYTGDTDVEVAFRPDDTGATFWIDNVALLASEAIMQCSNCFSLAEAHEHTLMFFASNSDNAFDFDYVSSSFRHKMRVTARLRYKDYPEEAETYRFSDNSYRLTQARTEKIVEVIVHDADEHVHDCLRMMRLHDNFEIDDEVYIKDSDYGLKRRNRSSNAPASFDVKKAQQISSNRSC